MCASSAARQHHFIETNGQRFHVVTSGVVADKLPILCLPGAMGTAEGDFAHQLDGLSPSRMVVSFDPRGYGQSRPPRRTFGKDFYHVDATDAAGIMQELGHSAYHVVGWSDGATSGVILAAQHPEAVKTLVVFGIQASVSKEDIEVYEGMRDVEKAWSKRALETHRAVYGDDVQPMWSGFCDAMKMLHEAGGDLCQKETLQITCPTLILHGENDPLVSRNHPEWVHKNAPNSLLHVFPGGKHNIHQKFAEKFNSLILDFCV